MRFQVRLLGRLDVRRDTETVELPRNAARVLVALALRSGHQVSAEGLVEVLWPEREGYRPARPNASLQQLVYRLRDKLGKEAVAWIDGAYRLRLDDPVAQLDVARWQRDSSRAMAAHQQQDWQTAWEGFAAALKLWRGRVLDGAVFVEDFWVKGDIARLEDQRLAATVAWAQAGLALGHYQALIEQIGALLNTTGSRAREHERIWEVLIGALYLEGRQTAAHRAYTDAIEILTPTAGDSPPGGRLQQLHAAVAAHDTPTVQRILNLLPAQHPPPQPLVQPIRTVVTVLAAQLPAVAADADTPDPEDGQAVHAAAEGVVGRYGGLVVATQPVLLAAWGAATSYEDDPERAVRAVLDLRALLGEVRAGIATMPAVVDLAASRADQQVSGGVLAAAEQLRAQAPEGLVVVDAATHAATEQQFDYQPFQDIWRLVGARGRTGARVVATASPLVERDQELSLLEDMFKRFLEHQKPQLLTVISEPGLGKSRLVAELGRLVDSVPELISWRVGYVRPYNQSALGAVVDVVKAEVGILEGDATEVVRQKLAHAVALTGDAATVARALEKLLGVADAEQRNARDEYFDGVLRFLVAVADRRPLVVAIEDIQWADDTLLDLIHDLTVGVGAVPLLMVTTGRPELLDRRPGWSSGHRNALTITLSALSRAGTGRLLDALLGAERLPTDTREALLDASGGNPLYVEEYVRMLATPGSRPTPTTIQQLIGSRLRTLPDADRWLLADAAVIGETGFLGQLAAVAEVGRDTAAAGLRRLEHREFLHRLRASSVAGETEWAFRHTLIREVAYSQLLRADRAEKHRRAASWLESLPGDHVELRTYHYSRALELARAAGQPARRLAEQTRVAWRHAGDRAAQTGSYAAAARAYTAALELWPAGDPDRAELLLSLARAQLADSPALETLRQASQAAVEAELPQAAAEADALLAAHAWQLEDWSARERLRRGLEVASSTLQQPAVLPALLNYAISLMQADRHRDAIAAARRLVDRARAEQRPELAAAGAHLAGELRILTGDLEGREECEHAIKVIDATEFKLGFIARYALARALWWYGDLDGCAAVVEASRARAAAGGHPDRAAGRWFDGLRVALGYAAGRWEEAVAIAEQALAQDPPGVRVVAECRLFRGLIHLARGRVDEALADARAAKASIAPQDVRYWQAARAVEGRCLLTAGQRKAASACLDDVLADQAARPAQSCATLDEAALLLELGYPAGALPEVHLSYPVDLLDKGLPPTRWHLAVRALVDRDVGRATTLLDTLGVTVDVAAVGARQRT